MKAVLCFFISGPHILNKEHLWIPWVNSNHDILEVVFHCTDPKKIVSPWIQARLLPKEHLVTTSYYHMVPAYMSALDYAYRMGESNQWFCLFTESCVPLVSPARFRALFLEHSNKSLFRWKRAWWNPLFHKRANLKYLPDEYRLGHDPYFVLTRRHVAAMVHFIRKEPAMYQKVLAGGLANESVFAVAFQNQGILDTQNDSLINASSTAADWSRMSSATSPHLFRSGDAEDQRFLNQVLQDEPFTMFLRKVATEFPDAILLEAMK
jgi:hypothetical protein